jgi:hypothetical protein
VKEDGEAAKALQKVLNSTFRERALRSHLLSLSPSLPLSLSPSLPLFLSLPLSLSPSPSPSPLVHTTPPLFFPSPVSVPRGCGCWVGACGWRAVGGACSTLPVRGWGRGGFTRVAPEQGGVQMLCTTCLCVVTRECVWGGAGAGGRLWGQLGSAVSVLHGVPPAARQGLCGADADRHTPHTRGLSTCSR